MSLVPCRFPVAAFCGLTLLFASAATAQVPDGHVVVGTFAGPISVGTCGLFDVSLATGAVTPITGLPPELAQPGGIGHQQGVNSVALRPTDGAIVVGTVGSALNPFPFAGNIDLFVLHLNGLAVDPARTVHITLGTTTNTGGAVVGTTPDGRILLFAADGNGALTGAMTNHLMAIVDVSTPTPTFTFIPDPVVSGTGGGFALDPTGQHAYYASTTNMGRQNAVATIYHWDMTSTAPCIVGSWVGKWAKSMACDDDGTLYLSVSDAATLAHEVITVVPAGCSLATWSITRSSMALPPSNIAFDRATGSFVMAAMGWAPGFPTTYFNSLSTVSRNGAAALLTLPYSGGWGLMGGIAVNNAMETYGAPTDGLNHHWFQNLPNPGGSPTVGNAGFSLTMRSTPGAASVSMLGLSFGSGSTTVAGVEVLLDLNTLIAVSVPAGLSSTYALAVPNDPSLAGAVLTAQSFHLESSAQLAASAGLMVTIQ